MIQTFLFDMGNVLVYFCHDRMCRQMAEACGTDAAAMRKFLFDSGLQADFERGQLSESDLHQRLEDEFAQSVDFDNLVKAGSDIFTLNEAIVPVLDGLKAQGYRLVLLSNTSISHLNWVKQEWDILDRFDHLVTSYEAGAVKPEAGIYKAALAAANCAPSECFYTDDIPEYIQTARGYGIDAEVFTDTASLLGQLALREIHPTT